MIPTRSLRHALAASFVALLGVSCASKPAGVAPGPVHDIVIRGGTVYDGSGGAPRVADVALDHDRITAVEEPGRLVGRTTVDATGLAVAPGFINVLSWATESLLQDGRGQSDLRQGVTLEVFGEGWSMGPLNDALKKEVLENQGDIHFPITWTTLDEYLRTLEARGISLNVASFVGATTVRQHVLGNADRPPSAAELETMKGLVRKAMEDGALGVGSSLIYAPAFYAKTDELVALCRVAAEYDGLYITHMRSEGNRLLEALDEVMTIARQAGIRAEIYHLKAAGEENWGKLDEVIARVEKARAEGLALSADMYTYTAGATGLDASMPPWVQEGGIKEWVKRLKDPATRDRVRTEMRTRTDAWENLMLAAGSPDKVLLVGFKTDALKPLTGKTLAEVSRLRGTSPEDTAMDLVIEDGTRIETVYFLMSEDNVRKQIRLPWVSFGSDADAQSPEGPFLKSAPHPRAYGNVARLLGRYVRDEKLVPLEDAIRRLTSLPAKNLRLEGRGSLAPGSFADVVVFDPRTIQDHATFEKSQQFATGVTQVFVNGAHVLRDGVATGGKAGRVLRRSTPRRAS